MKVIICGAGEVGKTLAEYLSKEKNDVINLKTKLT